MVTKYKYKVIRTDFSYHGETASEAYKCKSPDDAFQYITDNPIKRNEWAKYTVEVVEDV